MFEFLKESTEEKALREKIEGMIANLVDMEIVLREAGVSTEDELDEILDTDPIVKIMKPISVVLLSLGYFGVDADSVFIVVPSFVLIIFSLFLVFAFFGKKAFSNMQG